MRRMNQFTKAPYLVLFMVLIAIGVGTASALITITLSGDVIIIGSLDMTGDKITNLGTPTVSSDAATKGYVDSSPAASTVTRDFVNVLDPNVGDGLAIDTSIAIGTDGFPVVSYFDGRIGASDLRFVHCTSINCSTADSPIVVDNEGNVGNDTAIAITTDGFPIISYYGYGDLDLKIIKVGV
jgi:hypothetical protein